MIEYYEKEPNRKSGPEKYNEQNENVIDQQKSVHAEERAIKY